MLQCWPAQHICQRTGFSPITFPPPPPATLGAACTAVLYGAVRTHACQMRAMQWANDQKMASCPSPTMTVETFADGRLYSRKHKSYLGSKVQVLHQLVKPPHFSHDAPLKLVCHSADFSERCPLHKVNSTQLAHSIGLGNNV